jgi:hypothetical protein
MGGLFLDCEKRLDARVGYTMLPFATTAAGGRDGGQLIFAGGRSNGEAAPKATIYDRDPTAAFAPFQSGARSDTRSGILAKGLQQARFTS